MRTVYVTARTTGRRTWLSCAAWLSIWPRGSPRKRRSRLSSNAPDGITPTWSPSSPKPQKAKCDSPENGGTVVVAPLVLSGVLNRLYQVPEGVTRLGLVGLRQV